MRNFFQLFFLLSPYILFMILSFFSPWFLFVQKPVILSLSATFSILTIVLYFCKIPETVSPSFLMKIFFSLPLLCLSLGMFLFPIQNLNLGDGIILLENLAIEAKNYGYQIILDEMLEGLLHSYLYNSFQVSDPRTVYYYISSFSGICLILLSIFLLKKEWLKNPLSWMLFSASGGSLIFFGYFENYTLVSFWIFCTALFVYFIYESNYKGIYPLIIIAILSAIGCMFHLVFGYTLFSLLFLAWNLSDKKDFFKNSLISGFIAIVLLIGFFGYFLFFSDLRLDPAQGHATNPRFYPIRKIISMGHLKEIFSVMLFNSLPAILIISYFLIFEKKYWKEFIEKPFGKYLVLLLGGFLLHGFVHDPQLGFPADWDLMGFYWIPLFLIAVFLLFNYPFYKSILFTPILLFSSIFIMLTSIQLNQKDQKKEGEVAALLKLVDQFSLDYKREAPSILAEHRKFHVRTLFFLYRTKHTMKYISGANELLQENISLEQEFLKKYPDFNKEWKKDFLFRATRYHEKYLELIQNKR